VFYLRGSKTQEFANLSMLYGAPNSYPVADDWTGSDVSTIGVFNPTHDLFQLSNSNTPGAPDESFLRGIASDQPLAGHRQTNATCDGVGVFRLSNDLNLPQKCADDRAMPTHKSCTMSRTIEPSPDIGVSPACPLQKPGDRAEHGYQRRPLQRRRSVSKVCR